MIHIIRLPGRVRCEILLRSGDVRRRHPLIQEHNLRGIARPYGTFASSGPMGR
jgi:hypothetical protein